MKHKHEAATGKTIQAVMDAPIQKIKDLCRGREGIVSFAQGLPWFGPPPQALDRALERLKRGEGDGYSPTAGRDMLREMLAEDLRRRGIVQARAGNVLATPGANQAIYIALATLADPGDEVILFRPYYFNNLMALQMLGLKPVLVDAGADGAIDPERVRERINRRTRAMIVISPNNPSGAVLERQEGLRRLAVERGIWLISDEAYRDFAWERPHVSPLAAGTGNVIGVFSFSKSFGMAGWRLGFMHAPPTVIAQAMKAADTLHICAGLPAQLLAEEALASDPGYPGRFREEMLRSRDLLLAALAPLHEKGLVGDLRSEGGFYLLVGLAPRRPLSGWDAARRLVEEFAVAAVPGEAFGLDERPFLRLSYGNIRPGLMAAAAPRLAAALTALLAS
jgi:aspartate/methionine/tyrosine aminotransferase